MRRTKSSPFHSAIDCGRIWRKIARNRGLERIRLFPVFCSLSMAWAPSLALYPNPIRRVISWSPRVNLHSQPRDRAARLPPLLFFVLFPSFLLLFQLQTITSWINPRAHRQLLLVSGSSINNCVLQTRSVVERVIDCSRDLGQLCTNRYLDPHE